ncbi:uncharacterized protein B0I36DRAFT_256990 [Microdochium trichocladiopsis]|uniref:DUF6604 domain-containing protein n=1 Tax=Microdochium trichocladiopsis TaxID=1682393 RepID=A0A9P9BFG0_9PEZI|nr:uncharacterized protein B0I36DRAFT_256990 [Microdochium trichocladiopsis]KAH7012090.1 hypothetical protein B0I36DRAFT_256990 [Microdochium trichocladiopsis]
MLPPLLKSKYTRYKEGTAVVAEWLKSTASSLGYKTSASGGSAAAPSRGGRRKGKARAQAKMEASAASATISPSTGPVSNFFGCALDRTITARSEFAKDFRRLGLNTDEHIALSHEHFVKVLSQVRGILLPGQKPLDAALDPGAPESPTVGSPVFAMKVDDTYAEAIFALTMLINELNELRSRVRWIWENYKSGFFDLAAAALATETVARLARDIIKDVTPLIEDSGGLKKLLTDFYVLQLRLKGWKTKKIFVRRSGSEDNFNYSTYDEAENTLFAAFRLLEFFVSSRRQHELPVYRDSTYSRFDPSLGPRQQKTGEQKFEDDRALAVPLFSDLLTIVRCVPDWPVYDSLMFAIREIDSTDVIPLHAVFALQCHLDITYTLAEAISDPYDTLAAQTRDISNDLAMHLGFHRELKSSRWPDSNDDKLRRIRSSITRFMTDDPVGRVQRTAECDTRSAIDTGRGTANGRMPRSSPMMCGLLLYHYRAQYRDAGLAIADAWGSISCAMHLLNAVEKEGMLSIEEEEDGGWSTGSATTAKFKKTLPWVDMDLVRMIFGNESFFVDGKPPAGPAEYLKLFFQQVGGALAVDSTKQRQQRGRTGKEQSTHLQAEHEAGARRLKPGAPVQTMFKRRYVHQTEEQIDLSVLQETVHLGITGRKLGSDGSGHATKGFMLARIQDEVRAWRIRQQAAMAGTPQRQAPVIDLAENIGQAATTADELIECLTLTLHAETVEFAFPLLRLHRLCWEVLRAVDEECHAALARLFGKRYIEHNDQLPWVVGLIFGAASVSNMVPLKLAARALRVFLDSGRGDVAQDMYVKMLIRPDV